MAALLLWVLADAVEESRPGCGLKAHDEFMKNLRFLQRNGIPDWA